MRGDVFQVCAAREEKADRPEEPFLYDILPSPLAKAPVAEFRVSLTYSNLIMFSQLKKNILLTIGNN